MICQQLSTLLGFDCTSLNEEGDVVLVSTPFKFSDGDALPVYAEALNGQIRFFDDGQTVAHFLGRGVNIGSRRQATFISNSATKAGAVFTDKGEVETWASMEKASDAFSRYLSAMIAVSTWERDQVGTNTDVGLFVEEVAMALRAWKPRASITLEPAFEGVSGRSHKFDFLVDDVTVAATGSHPNSVSALLHKLVDIRGRLANEHSKFLIVIDDRQDPEASRREEMILEAVAQVMPFSALEKASSATRTGH